MTERAVLAYTAERYASTVDIAIGGWRRSVVVSALASISVVIVTGPGYYLDR